MLLSSFGPPSSVRRSTVWLRLLRSLASVALTCPPPNDVKPVQTLDSAGAYACCLERPLMAGVVLGLAVKSVT